MKAIAEQFVAQPIPLTADERKTPAIWSVAARRGLEPALILGRRRGWTDVLRTQQPQPARGGVQLRPVIDIEIARPFASRRESSPPSASAFRCRLTVDCGSWMMLHSSETVSS